MHDVISTHEDLVEDFREMFSPSALAPLFLILLTIYLLPIGVSKRPPGHFFVGFVSAAFGYAYLNDFDVVPVRFFGPSESRLKPYTNFTKFYDEAYEEAHVLPNSRNFHVLLYFGFLACFASDSRLFVPYVLSLLVGAMATLPLIGTDLPFAEFYVVAAVGTLVAKRYGVALKWLTLFQIWVTLDYLDHYFLGYNGKTALYIGEHYISWALIGQAKLTTGIVLGHLGF